MMPGGLAAGGADETGRRKGVGDDHTGQFGIGIPFFFQEGMPVSKNRCAESANRCLASLAMLLFIKT